jgi:hypothetical protein
MVSRIKDEIVEQDVLFPDMVCSVIYVFYLNAKWSMLCNEFNMAKINNESLFSQIRDVITTKEPFGNGIEP